MGSLSIRQGAGIYSVEGSDQLIATIAAFLVNPLKSQFRQAAAESPQKLEEFLTTKQQQLLAAIPDDIHYILQPLREFNSTVIELAELGKRGSGKKNYAFQIGASATLKLAVEKADELTPPPAFNLNDQHLLIGLRLAGDANISTTARGSHGILSASISASAGAEQSLAFYGSRPRYDRLLHYVLQIPRQIATPTDLDALIESLDSGALLRFERLGIPAMQLGLRVDIAPAVKEFAGAIPVNAELGGNLSVQYKDSSRCQIVLERRGPNAYVLDLHKSRKKTLSKSMQLGVDLQLVGFKNQLLEKVTRALPQNSGIAQLLGDLDAIIAEVSGETLKPSLISGLEKKWPEARSAVAFLVGDKTADSLETELQAELLDRVLEAINAQVDLVNQSAEAVANRVGCLVARQLQLPLSHRDCLESYLSFTTKVAVTDFQNRLEGRLSDYIREEGAVLGELLEPWEFLGEKVSDAIASAGSNAQAAVSRMRAALGLILARYTALRQRVLQVVREDFEEKVALTITAEKQRTEHSSTALRLEFTQATDLIRRLYRDLWNGNLQKATTLLQQLEIAPETIRLSGEYVSMVQEMHKSTLAINFFGMAFRAEEIFSTDSQVALNANGILVVAEGEGRMLERVNFFGETQTVIGSWRLDPLSEIGLSPPVILKICVEDPSFEVGREIDDFFEPLESSALVRHGLGDEVESSLSQLGFRKIAAMRLAFSLVFRWEDWLRLMGVDAKGKELNDSVPAEEFSDQYLRLLETTAKHFVEDARRLFSGDTRAEFKQVLLQVGKIRSLRDFKNLLGRSSGTLTSSQRNAWNTARYVHDIHSGLIALRSSWLNLVRAMPEEGVVLDLAAMESLKRHIGAVNNELANLLDSSTRQTGLDQSRLTGFTAAGLKLLLMQTSSPNPFSSCVLDSTVTGKLLFN